MCCFTQIFVLAAQYSKKYYAHNGIFHYLDKTFDEDDFNEEVDSGKSVGEQNGDVK